MNEHKTILLTACGNVYYSKFFSKQKNCSKYLDIREILKADDRRSTIAQYDSNADETKFSMLHFHGASHFRILKLKNDTNPALWSARTGAKHRRHRLWRIVQFRKTRKELQLCTRRSCQQLRELICCEILLVFFCHRFQMNRTYLLFR